MSDLNASNNGSSSSSSSSPSISSSSSSSMSSLLDASVAEARRKAFEVALKLGLKAGGGGGGGSGGGAGVVAVLGKRNRFDDNNSNASVISHDRKRKRINVPISLSPEQNWFGLLVGPRGKTLQSMQEESGARILIRGRGASKEGEEGENEDMYVVILADDDNSMMKAEKLVNDLLFNPEKMNAVKSEQLKTVAEMNGASNTMNGGQDGMHSSFNTANSQHQANSIGINNNSSNDRSVEISIPNDKVGLVIGKSGDTIRQIQMSTGAKVQIGKEPIQEPANSSNGSSTTSIRLVTLIGRDDQISAAEAEIKKVVNAGGFRGGGSFNQSQSHSHTGLGFHSSDHHNNNVEKMRVPQTMVGLLIGKSGETIRNLQSRHSCQITIARESDGTDTREVSIIGQGQSRENAKKEIESIIQQQIDTANRGRDRHDSSNTGYLAPPGVNGVNPYSSSPSTTFVMRVSNNVVGIIIGRDGENIKRIQSQTGSRMQIDKSDNRNERDLIFTGQAEAVEYAKKEVELLLRTKQTVSSPTHQSSPYQIHQTYSNYPYETPSQPPPDQYQSLYQPYPPPPPGVTPPIYDTYPSRNSSYEYYNNQPFQQLNNQSTPSDTNSTSNKNLNSTYYQTPQPPGIDTQPSQTYIQQNTSTSSVPLNLFDNSSTPIASSVSSVAASNDIPTATSSSSPSSASSSSSLASLPPPPSDPAAFTEYWQNLSYDQQQQYYATYYGQYYDPNNTNNNNNNQ